MLTHLDDLRSDFSAVHRIDDMYALPGPDFFALAYRITAYPSVVAVRRDVQEQEKHRAAQPQPAATGVATRYGELTEDQVEQLRQQTRIQDFPKALGPGEQPRYVPLNQLIREST